MGRIRRGGYVFQTWSGDHLPKHVHIFKDDDLIVKWDLEKDRPMLGHASRQVRELIEELKAEGRL